MDSSKNARPSSFRPLVPGASASLASTSNSNSVSVNPQKSTYLLKPSILAKVASYNSEIEFIDAEIDRLKEARAEFVVLRTKAERELDGLSASAKLPSSALEARASTSGMRKPSAAIDYTTEFEWSGEMKRKMKKVFGIDNFRLCQEG
jgi:ATP-dependent DNA helicase Q1